MSYEKRAKSLMLLARKMRKGIRPYRVSTFLAKHGSLSGQDLRLPLMGGSRFPTKDSLDVPKKMLSMSQKASEAGPIPTIGKLTSTGPKMEDIIPQTGGRNIMPKLASLSDYDKDPLIQYLRMSNSHGPLNSNYSYDQPCENRNEPTTGRPDQSSVCPCGRLDDNKDELRTDNEVDPLTMGSPYMPRQEASEIRSDLREYLKDQFTADKGFRRKGSEKDHSYGGESESVVDKVLNW